MRYSCCCSTPFTIHLLKAFSQARQIYIYMPWVWLLFLFIVYIFICVFVFINTQGQHRIIEVSWFSICKFLFSDFYKLFRKVPKYYKKNISHIYSSLNINKNVGNNRLIRYDTIRFMCLFYSTKCAKSLTSIRCIDDVARRPLFNSKMGTYSIKK